LSLFCASAVLLACGRSTVITEIPTVESILPVATSTQAKIFLPGKEIHFEVVETNDTYSADMSSVNYDRPEVIAVWEPTQLVQLVRKVSAESFDEAERVDFSAYILIAIFEGRQATSGYDVMVDKVIEQSDKIIIDTHFLKPGPGIVVSMYATAPYQIIRIKKNDLAKYPLDVNLHAKTITYGPGTPPPGDDNQTKPPAP